MRVAIALLALGALPFAPAAAKEPLTLRVQPSGVDDASDAAQAREARLQRRMQDADYLFRNICIHCGGGVERPGSNAPFNPVETLGRRR